MSIEERVDSLSEAEARDMLVGMIRSLVMTTLFQQNFSTTIEEQENRIWDLIKPHKED